MSSKLEELQAYLNSHLEGKFTSSVLAWGELSLEIPVRSWLDVCNFLRHDEQTQFEQLSDLCGVDYSTYGQAEWDTQASSTGFSRAVPAQAPDLFDFDQVKAQATASEAATTKRFAVVIHLLSLKHNRRIRLRTFCEDHTYPVVPSIVRIWSSANWYEREAFDLVGIMFNYHPDLRRILTDYGFIGHPLRKDFPLAGQVEMRYDPLQRRVIYEPVSIVTQPSVPRVIRQDQPPIASQESSR
ncbi:NADH-quinone oxidoreductase subunit C [Thiothrix eikelboomii]|uniref:NADH-quinone oxidoreductase subunit C n=1 Tax=Thiothrix eikelboomii TaxID=92487 RepID=UPI003BAF2BFA